VNFPFVCNCISALRHCCHLQGEWKPKQISNPAYKGKWVHPEIENPEYQPDENLYRYTDIGAIGFDLWQVCFFYILVMLNNFCELSQSTNMNML